MNTYVMWFIEDESNYSWEYENLKSRHHMWRCSGFWGSDVTPCTKLSQNFTTSYTWDVMTPHKVLRFFELVWIFYNLKHIPHRLKSQGSRMKRARARVFSCTRPWISVSTINIDISCIEMRDFMHLSSYLHFSTNSLKRKKARNIAKCLQTNPYFDMLSQ